ncbi:hypothetical protein [Burkholderia cepacia]|uniref:hypothetical protein n=1 Tax=Burkholderia cepacia TaxID=292 RepID=UPI000A650C62|nr:hypothetical protein [Burkholderia cepacia]
MSILIELTQRIAAEDVLAWPNPSGKNLAILISRSAEFEAGAEGLALSFLSTSLKHSSSIDVECQFEFPTQKVDFLGSILSSTFGYALLRACNCAEFKDFPGKNSAVELRRLAGKIYDDQSGAVGSGDRAGIIAFDPKRPTPRALQDSYTTSESDTAPLPSQFAPGISRVLGSMGLGDIASQSSFTLLRDYIFETFVNTFQHGRPRDPRVARHSTRSISITKIAFNVAQLENRRMSKEMREYLLRIADMEKTKKDLFLACISVMDMGEGIQNTLPPASNEETPSDRLLRAFKLRETRKPGSPVERGLGLQKVVDAAFLLGARLQVLSSGRRLVKDFSLGEDKLPGMQGAIMVELPQHFAAGTCIDLFVPKLLSNIDQRELAL